VLVSRKYGSSLLLRGFMLLLVASALLASAEPAATSPAPTTAPAAPAPTAKPRRICKVDEAVIGSLTPKRVCVTVPQDAPAASKPAQDAARDKQPQAASTASGTSN